MIVDSDIAGFSPCLQTKNKAKQWHRDKAFALALDLAKSHYYRDVKAYVVDIGFVPHADCFAVPMTLEPIERAGWRTGAFYIVELNCWNCSDFYDCDLEPIVEAVGRVVGP